MPVVVSVGREQVTVLNVPVPLGENVHGAAEVLRAAVALHVSVRVQDGEVGVVDEAHGAEGLPLRGHVLLVPRRVLREHHLQLGVRVSRINPWWSGFLVVLLEEELSGRIKEKVFVVYVHAKSYQRLTAIQNNFNKIKQMKIK